MPHGAAATAPPADDGWQFALAPYLWAVSQKGDITAKGHKGEVDLGFDDILSNLDVALLLSAEARQGDTVLRLDQSYLAVSDEVKQGPVEIEASQRAYFATIKVGQALGDGPEAPIVFVGARYWNLGLDVELKAVGGPTLSSADGSQDWWDPLVAAEKRWELDDRWSLVAGADVGGFGVGDGSDSTWQAALLFSRKTDSGGSVVMGWRHLSIDRSDGSGPDRFEFDMRISGPLFGWAFRF
ncbi:MAG: hypothetical protein DRQ55_07175 [Planctomycetota bacterium]|nr:MAG: hypothetical protein DRQ55_07175 [Planctomycetota bacterium]